MAILKCKMCGGELEVTDGMSVCECEYCGTKQTVPTIDDEKKINMFTRANRLRSSCEFDKAETIYESIVSEFPEEAEAYWGIILCKYGIEYIDDPATGNKVPTCHRTSFESVFEDDNFELVMEYSDAISRRVYRDEAKQIEELRESIINISSKEEPFDIFICYKDRSESGERTLDSIMAQEVYDELTKRKYKVFFSRITLEDKLGEEYEPYIFAALNSAQVMLVFGSDYEYFNAVWVKNEWMRFIKLMAKGEKKTLIPCYKTIDAYDMPKEFSKFQSQDMGKIGAMQDLLKGIDKIFGRKEDYDVYVNKESASALVRRGNMALEDGDYKLAANFFERALDNDPADGYAYLGRFLLKQRVVNIEDLKDKIIDYESDRDFFRAQQFADGKLKRLLATAIDVNKRNIEKKEADHKAFLDGKKKVLTILFNNEKELFNEAERIYKDFEEKGIRVGNTYSLQDMFSIVSHMGAILSDRKMHTKDSLVMAYGGEKSQAITEILEELKNNGLAEEHILLPSKIKQICLPGVKEEYDNENKRKALEKQENKKKEERYKAACGEVEGRIQEELKPIVKRICESYDPQIEALRKEMGNLQASANRERVKTELELFNLKAKEKTFGMFDKQRKIANSNQIIMVKKKLDSFMTSDQIAAKYQPQIDDLIVKKKAEIIEAENTIREKNRYPDRSDYM